MGKRLHRFHQNQKRHSCCKERKAQPYTLEPPQRKHVKRERKENQRKQFLFLRKCARIGSPSTSLSTRSNPHTKPRPMGGAFSCLSPLQRFNCSLQTQKQEAFHPPYHALKKHKSLSQKTRAIYFKTSVVYFTIHGSHF